MACEIAYRKRKSIESGGYYYEYKPVESVKFKQVLKKNIDYWYYQMNKLIENEELIDDIN